jgi:hypothetical protein
MDVQRNFGLGNERFFSRFGLVRGRHRRNKIEHFLGCSPHSRGAPEKRWPQGPCTCSREQNAAKVSHPNPKAGRVGETGAKIASFQSKCKGVEASEWLRSLNNNRRLQEGGKNFRASQSLGFSG